MPMDTAHSATVGSFAFPGTDSKISLMQNEHNENLVCCLQQRRLEACYDCSRAGLQAHQNREGVGYFVYSANHALTRHTGIG